MAKDSRALTWLHISEWLTVPEGRGRGQRGDTGVSRGNEEEVLEREGGKARATSVSLAVEVSPHLLSLNI